jgi:hypothetical protein
MPADLLSKEVSRQSFSSHHPAHENFPSPDLSSTGWSIYRTRFLVRAKQLTQALTFTDPLGREHHGAPGDYLVQSSEGLLRIAPREIFEDVYVILQPELGHQPLAGGSFHSTQGPKVLSA